MGFPQKIIKPPCARVHTQSCDPMDCSLPGFSVHEILQGEILKWVVISSSRGSSWPRDRTHVSCISMQIFFTTDPPGEPPYPYQELPYVSGIPFLDVYLKKIKIVTQNYICSSMFAVALFTVQPKLSINWWMDKENVVRVCVCLCMYIRTLFSH